MVLKEGKILHQRRAFVRRQMRAHALLTAAGSQT